MPIQPARPEAPPDLYAHSEAPSFEEDYESQGETEESLQRRRSICTMLSNTNAAIPPSTDERQLLDRRQEALRTHLSNMRAAVRVLRERQQAFLAYVSSSADQEADNEAYQAYMQESRVEDAAVAAEKPHPSASYEPGRSQRTCRKPTSKKSRQQTRSPSLLITSQRSRQFLGSLRGTLHPYGTADSHSATIVNSQVPHQSTIQLGKLTLEPFSGDITQFQRFWRAFEVAIHDDVTISTTYKFLYLQSLPQGRSADCVARSGPRRVQLLRVTKDIQGAPVGTQAVGIAQEVIMNSCANTVHGKRDRVVVLVGTTLTGRADTTTSATGENTVRHQGQISIKKSLTEKVIVAGDTPTAIAHDPHLGRIVTAITVHGLTLQQRGTRVRQTVLLSIHHRAIVNIIVPCIFVFGRRFIITLTRFTAAAHHITTT
ncbi:hypothetical protein OSTOST_24987, partial [Ostertagia ostertagi]